MTPNLSTDADSSTNTFFPAGFATEADTILIVLFCVFFGPSPLFVVAAAAIAANKRLLRTTKKSLQPQLFLFF